MPETFQQTEPLRGFYEAATAPGRPLPPVEAWHPGSARAIDMRIDRHGVWHYLGSPIARPAMVRLFSTILRGDEDGSFCLVTPAERCIIEVEDAPFLATTLTVRGEGHGQTIGFTTNVGDEAVVSQDHPLRFAAAGEPGLYLPYVTVRGRLEARIARNVYYELMEHTSLHARDGEDWIGLWSAGSFWPIAPAAGIG